MKKKQKRGVNPDIAATTTSKDWGFGPIPGKGGKTTNYDESLTDSFVKRVIREGK